MVMFDRQSLYVSLTVVTLALTVRVESLLITLVTFTVVHSERLCVKGQAVSSVQELQ